MQWPDIAVASAACFQVDRKGIHRLVAAQLPPGFPISAVASEFYAFALAADSLPKEGQIPEIVSDCQAVVQAFANLDRHADYRSKFAGMWRNADIKRVPFCKKVKAHLCQQEAIELGLEEDWFGNDKADYWAKDTLADTWKDGEAYVKDRKEQSTKVCHLAEQVADKLVQVLREIPKEARPKKPTKALTVPHQFVWRKDRWYCIGCGCIKRNRTSRLDLVSCHTRKTITLACHGSHRLFGAWEAAAAVQIGHVGMAPITFCIRCGCYSSTRLVDLKHKCIVTTARSNITIIKRLQAKIHPSTKAPLVGVHRIRSDTAASTVEVMELRNPGLALDIPATQLLEPPSLDAHPEYWEVEDDGFVFDFHEEGDLEFARTFGLLE